MTGALSSLVSIRTFNHFDELTAFVRPRIQLDSADWLDSLIHEVLTSDSPATGYQRRALTDSNQNVATIDSLATESVMVPFDSEFNYDSPGC